MNSPDYIPFSQFIKIDRRKSDAVYLQIVYQFIQAVQRGLLSDGNKIPGSRNLSKELGVHRKTIISALEELQTQGWVSIKPAVGTFVRNPDFDTKNEDKPSAHNTAIQNAAFQFRKNIVLDAPNQKFLCPYHFTTGKPDYRIIKTSELSRFYSSALKRKNIIKKIPQYLASGNPFFQNQLSYYINLTRGFHISNNHLITSPNRQTLLYILSQLLIKTGDTVLVAAYSYHFSNMVFQQAGARVATIPIDQEGISIDYMKKNFAKEEIKLVYIQPQHQYPTTVCLSSKRRKELLELAETQHFILIEDDPNDEFTFEKDFQVPLLKMKHSGSVIYLGNFGRFLAPGFQTNFMIGPQDYIKEAKKYLQLFGRMDIVKEQALGEMIYEGDIHRYRRKALTTYLYRRNLFANLLKESFQKKFNFQIPKGGLAFWIQLQAPVSLHLLSENCKRQGLFIPNTCLYQDKQTTALRLGFGNFNKKEMEEALHILSESYQINMKDKTKVTP